VNKLSRHYSVLFGVILVFMAGCSQAPVIKYVDRPVQVEIMVPADIPEPPVINRPFLPIELLQPENIVDPDKIARYYVKSVRLLETYAAQLQCALDAYRTESEAQCPIIIEE
jgi:hypothetical protein